MRNVRAKTTNAKVLEYQFGTLMLLVKDVLRQFTFWIVVNLWKMSGVSGIAIVTC